MALNFEDTLKMTGHFELFAFEGETPIISGSRIIYDKNKTKLIESYSDHNLIVSTGRKAVKDAMTPLNEAHYDINGNPIQGNPITYLACGCGAYGMDGDEPVIDTKNPPAPPSSATDRLTKEVYRTTFSSIEPVSALSVRFVATIPLKYPADTYPEKVNPDGSQQDIDTWINEYGLILADGTTLFAKVNKKSTPKSGDMSLIVRWVINF